MSAKAIIQRYLDRKRSQLPSDPLELREHLASVAERDGLKVTEEELDEMTGTPETGEPTPSPSEEGNKTVVESEGKQARKSRRGLKGGDSTKKEI